VSLQRKRGLPITVYPRKLATTARGDEQWVVDLENPITSRCWVSADRSTKAEVPGQQEVDVVKVGVPVDLEAKGLGIGARVTLLGDDWDVVQPPAYRHGTRHVRHLSVTLRRRPSGG